MDQGGDREAAGSAAAAALATADEPAQSAELRRAYELGEEPISTILARFGLKRSELRKLRERNNWKKRRSACPAPAREQGERSSLQRYGARLGRNLAALTARLERQAGQGGDLEGDARTLAELMRGWSFLAMGDAMTADRDGGKPGREHGLKKKKNDAGAETDRGSEIARQRAALKSRLEQLRRAADHGRD